MARTGKKCTTQVVTAPNVAVCFASTPVKASSLKSRGAFVTCRRGRRSGRMRSRAEPALGGTHSFFRCHLLVIRCAPWHAPSNSTSASCTQFRNSKDKEQKQNWHGMCSIGREMHAMAVSRQRKWWGVPPQHLLYKNTVGRSPKPDLPPRIATPLLPACPPLAAPAHPIIDSRRSGGPA